MMKVISSQLRQVLGGTLLGWNLAIASGMSAPIPGQAYCPDQFRQDVAALLEESEAATAQWGLLIRTQADGTVLLARQANKAFIPASNQKLLTTGVALAVLGPEFRFETPVYGRLDRQNTNRLSQLQLMASGDPSLQVSDLQAIAKKLRQRGITQIGQVQLVDEIPPQEQYRASWEWDDLLYYYAPPISRAILADNQVALTLTPQSVEDANRSVGLMKQRDNNGNC